MLQTLLIHFRSEWQGIGSLTLTLPPNRSWALISVGSAHKSANLKRGDTGMLAKDEARLDEVY